jgi:putative ABC transport system permease protein
VVRALAWRSVSARKGRALLNGLGIVLGVALFFSVLSLSQTIVSTFSDLFDSVYGDTDLTIAAAAQGQGTLPESLLEKVQRADGVEIAVPSVSSTISRVRDDGSSPGTKDQVFVAGVRPEDPDLSGGTVVEGNDKIVRGQLQLESGWAADNGIKAGDTVRFATTSGVHELKISGLYKFGDGVQFGGQGFAAIDMKTARKLFDIPRGYSGIDVKVEDGRNVSAVGKELERISPPGAEVNTPSEIADAINDQIQGFNLILYFFAAMSLFVGGFLILNSFNMTVAQRLREIGMLRTLGASRALIRRMILLEALILGIFGALIGVVIGLVLTKLMVALVSSIGFPIGAIKYPPLGFIVAPLLGIAATLLGALRPAIRASRIPPIQAVLVEHRTEKLKLGRRLAAGSALTLLGLLGVFVLASADDTPLYVVAAGVLGVIFLFTGVILLGPVVVPALVRSMAKPLRLLAPVEGRIAADNARSNPTRTASTASGLMIGIALVAAIGSLGSSFIGTISDQLDNEIKTDFTIQPRGVQGGPQPAIAERALGQVRALPDAKNATGVKTVYLASGEGEGQMVFAVDPVEYRQFSSPEYDPGAVADVDTALEHNGVVLPSGFAKSKSLAVGDSIKLEGPLGSEQLKVVGIRSGSSIEASSLVMALSTFDRLYGVNGYSQILAIAKSADQRGALGRQINRLLADNYPAFEALSNEQIKKQIKDQVNQLFSIFYVIMAVAILVSLLGVVNTLLMSVLERTREIGLLRAIGSSRWQVRRMIVAESLMITAAGAALGLIVGMALGWAFVRGISSGSTDVDFHPPVAVIVAVALLCVLAGILAAIPPARRAARMNVIDALSYE